MTDPLMEHGNGFRDGSVRSRLHASYESSFYQNAQRTQSNEEPVL